VQPAADRANPERMDKPIAEDPDRPEATRSRLALRHRGERGPARSGRAAASSTARPGPSGIAVLAREPAIRAAGRAALAARRRAVPAWAGQGLFRRPRCATSSPTCAVHDRQTSSRCASLLARPPLSLGPSPGARAPARGRRSPGALRALEAWSRRAGWASLVSELAELRRRSEGTSCSSRC